ncbi:hypothetical protein SPONL_1285 [uncultured Candidatus Thioglobus sp.]|nr:hypothetical protein SPONL_1285 [uncultured Candidatus Thioglobus sp.]
MMCQKHFNLFTGATESVSVADLLGYDVSAYVTEPAEK